MKSKLSIFPIFFIAVSSVVLIAQSPGQNAANSADVGTNQTQGPPTIEGAPIKDDARAKLLAFQQSFFGPILEASLPTIELSGFAVPVGPDAFDCYTATLDDDDAAAAINWAQRSATSGVMTNGAWRIRSRGWPRCWE